VRAAFEVFAGRNWEKDGKETKDGVEPQIEVAALKHALMTLGDKLSKEQARMSSALLGSRMRGSQSCAGGRVFPRPGPQVPHGGSGHFLEDCSRIGWWLIWMGLSYCTVQ
jgi:hypothetical protein